MNPILSNQVDAILDLLPRRWPHPALHVAVVQSPSMRSEEIRWYPDHSQLSKTETRLPRSHRSRCPASMRSSIPRRRLSLSVFGPFLRIYIANYTPGNNPSDCLLHPQLTLWSRFNDWGGGGGIYDDSVPGEVAKIAPFVDRTT